MYSTLSLYISHGTLSIFFVGLILCRFSQIDKLSHLTLFSLDQSIQYNYCIAERWSMRYALKATNLLSSVLSFTAAPFCKCHWSLLCIDLLVSSIEPFIFDWTSNPLTIFSILFSSDGELHMDFLSCTVGDTSIGLGDTEIGRFGGELDVARGRGLLLRLRGPPEFEPGVTASKAEPNPEGKLYGEKRWPFSTFSGDVGECPE